MTLRHSAHCYQNLCARRCLSNSVALQRRKGFRLSCVPWYRVVLRYDDDIEAYFGAFFTSCGDLWREEVSIQSELGDSALESQTSSSSCTTTVSYDVSLVPISTPRSPRLTMTRTTPSTNMSTIRTRAAQSKARWKSWKSGKITRRSAPPTIPECLHDVPSRESRTQKQGRFLGGNSDRGARLVGSTKTHP